MAIKKFIKDPDAVLDYTVDWSAWLPSGDTISAVSTSATAGITVDTSSYTTNSTTVWLSGGTEGTTYDVTIHITTNGGREDDRTIAIQVKEL